MPDDQAQAVIRLDENGDAVLDVEDPRSQELYQFLVSTKILSSASSVFSVRT
jgi:hypothetical protein